MYLRPWTFLPNPKKKRNLYNIRQELGATQARH